MLAYRKLNINFRDKDINILTDINAIVCTP